MTIADLTPCLENDGRKVIEKTIAEVEEIIGQPIPQRPGHPEFEVFCTACHEAGYEEPYPIFTHRPVVFNRMALNPAQPPVWKLVRKAVIALLGDNGGQISFQQIKDYILTLYEDVNPDTVDRQIRRCSVNSQARTGFHPHKQARIADGEYDFLFLTEEGPVEEGLVEESGLVEWYNPHLQRHGQWEIIMVNGVPQVHRIGENVPNGNPVNNHAERYDHQGLIDELRPDGEDGSDEITMTFADVERFYQREIPPRHKDSRKAPWPNQITTSFSKGWMIAGYKAKANFDTETVVFTRINNGNPVNNHEEPPAPAPRRRRRKHPREDIPRPSPEEVRRYLVQWNALPNYTAQESALNRLFREVAPLNTSLNDVLIKVAALNEFYSTNIPSVYNVARHIVAINNIDERLRAGDESLVHEISETDTRREFSFATKYCSRHNEDSYPIYDSYVQKLLCYLRNVDGYGFADFDDGELRDFPTFKRVILRMRQFYGLEAFTIKEIDKYLWQLGKEAFPRNNG